MWSVNLVGIFLQLDNIINMAALPKETIINYISSEQLEFVKSFNPIALIGIVCTVLVLLLLPVVYLLRRYKIVDNIYHKVFWNMLVRVLQGAYLPYCYTGVKSIIVYANERQDLKSLITNTIILSVIVVAVIVNAYVTLCSKAEHLNRKEIKAKYGTCYSDLDTTRKIALF